ncbi:hypothetical protein [Paenibacillus sp.]|uniref:hypothetical protein n=1 Tax=Paenibacillus sp. TaxID=58172 RepID=UPI002D25F364|nr:hypothetical protein [Paenibacillus sp.]HZG85589.1 hypothetical protein [Paenibacillus sp.]
MNPFRTYICEDDADFGRCMTFLLETRRSADPELRTADAYTAMLRILTYGTLLRFEDERGDVIGIVGYTMGTPQGEYEDRQIAYIEYCLMPVSRQGTTFFPKGLGILVRTIQERHPEAVWMTFAAAENHRRNNRLYAKFSRPNGQIEAPGVKLNLYTALLADIANYAAKFD